MIQLNLLPDVKIQYLKAQRNKRLVFLAAAVVSAVFVAATILLALHVYVNQAAHTSGLQNDIDEKLAEYQSIDELSAYLTVNEQLEALDGLHSDKPALSRLPGFLSVIIPSDITLTQLSINIANGTLNIAGRGSGDKLVVNRFADVLKNTRHTYSGLDTPTRTFQNVEFSYGIPRDNTYSFTARMDFNTVIFDIETDNVVLNIPDIVSTQSELRTSTLFDVPTEEEQADIEEATEQQEEETE